MYVVMSASAQMPSSCWGTYRRVAVVEIERGAVPKMISLRARGVVRVLRTWERLNVGCTSKCAYARALAEAYDYCDRLNAGACDDGAAL